MVLATAHTNSNLGNEISEVITVEVLVKYELRTTVFLVETLCQEEEMCARFEKKDREHGSICIHLRRVC